MRMIKQLNKVAYKKLNSLEIICKYGYIVHGLISEGQTLLVLMGDSLSIMKENLQKNKIIEIAKGRFINLKPLAEFLTSFEYNYEGQQYTFYQLKSKFIESVLLTNEQFSQIPLNWQLIEFFSLKNYKVKQKSTLLLKNILLLTQFSDQFIIQLQINENQHHFDERIKLIQQLTTARLNCQQLYNANKVLLGQDKRYEYSILMRRVTKNISVLLTSIKEYSLARRVYDSILYVNSVCKLYEEEIGIFKHCKHCKHCKRVQSNIKINKNVQSSSQSLSFNLHMQYGTYISTHVRDKQQVVMYQGAFELVSSKDQLQQVTKKLIDALELISQKNQLQQIKSKLIESLMTLIEGNKEVETQSYIINLLNNKLFFLFEYGNLKRDLIQLTVKKFIELIMNYSLEQLRIAQATATIKQKIKCLQIKGKIISQQVKK